MARKHACAEIVTPEYSSGLSGSFFGYWGACLRFKLGSNTTRKNVICYCKNPFVFGYVIGLRTRPNIDPRTVFFLFLVGDRCLPGGSLFKIQPGAIHGETTKNKKASPEGPIFMIYCCTIHGSEITCRINKLRGFSTSQDQPNKQPGAHSYCCCCWRKPIDACKIAWEAWRRRRRGHINFHKDVNGSNGAWFWLWPGAFTDFRYAVTGFGASRGGMTTWPWLIKLGTRRCGLCVGWIFVRGVFWVCKDREKGVKLVFDGILMDFCEIMPGYIDAIYRKSEVIFLKFWLKSNLLC